MDIKQIRFRAEPDGQVVELGPQRLIEAGDFLRWTADAYTTVDAGSPLIGERVGTRTVLRIGPKDDPTELTVLAAWDRLPKVDSSASSMDDKEMRCEVLHAASEFTELAFGPHDALLKTPLGLVRFFCIKQTNVIRFEWLCRDQATVYHFWMNPSSVVDLLEAVREAQVRRVPMAKLWKEAGL